MDRLAIASLLMIVLHGPALADDVLNYQGMCDASAAVAIDRSSFVVANDEDNTLRIYDRDKPGRARTIAIDAFLTPPDEDTSGKESDLEGAARIGNRIYWISSHGRNSEGKKRPKRHRLFATDIVTKGGAPDLITVGTPYTELVTALTQPALASLGLKDAAKLAPEENGLNIEGLAATPDGRLLIGLRSPVLAKGAIVVPLDNPAEVIEGRPPRLGQPILLPLDGRGIRSMDYVASRKGYLIVAGPPGPEGAFALYRWSGTAGEAPETLRDLAGHPEALFLYPDDPDTLHLLSDDGDEPVGGKPCKKAAASRQSFRAYAVKP
jgi:hypothetical protein